MITNTDAGLRNEAPLICRLTRGMFTPVGEAGEAAWVSVIPSSEAILILSPYPAIREIRGAPEKAVWRILLGSDGAISAVALETLSDPVTFDPDMLMFCLQADTDRTIVRDILDRRSLTVLTQTALLPEVTDRLAELCSLAGCQYLGSEISSAPEPEIHVLTGSGNLTEDEIAGQTDRL